MRSPRNSIASSVTNIGAVKLIAVKSASGIIVSAVNQQNMLAVPANERIACERSRSVRRIWKPWKCHAMNASTVIEITPRTKMIWPVGTPSPRYLTQAARHESTTTDDSFRATPRTGRCWCSFAANAGTRRELRAHTIAGPTALCRFGYSCRAGGLMRTTLITSLTIASLSSFAAQGQAPNAEALFTQHCAACHLNPTDEKAPTRAAMAALAPNAVVETLTDGTMRIQGQALSPGERVAIAELVTGRPVLAASARLDQGLCATSTPFAVAGSSSSSSWNGWGPDVRNTRFQR